MALELLSDQGFRVDGRRADELRRLQCRLGVFTQADGSAYVEQGNTKVLAAVYGPHEVRVFYTFWAQALVKVKYNVIHYYSTRLRFVSIFFPLLIRLYNNLHFYSRHFKTNTTNSPK